MALATRCPHCQTTFRVAHDQLKLRAGLVRCGACKEVFNGVEHLLRPDEMQEVLASSKPKVSSPPVKAVSSSPHAKEGIPSPHLPPSHTSAASLNDTQQGHNAEDAHFSAEHAPAVTNDRSAETAVPSENNLSISESKPLDSHEESSDGSSILDPLQRMTLMDITAFNARESQAGSANDDKNLSYADRTSDLSPEGAENPEASDELSQAIDDLQNKPWRHAKPRKKGGDSRDALGKRGKSEPNFMAHARRQKRYGKAMRITMSAGSAVLFIVLLLQGIFAFRHVIAGTMPQYRPVLNKLCAQVGCEVKLPAQIDKVSIESSELQSLPSSPSKFTLVALLRNQAATHQAWPNLELTLNDMNEKPVARKVFQPKDYLPSAESIHAGFPEQSEHQVKIAFEMQQLKAAGYRLYLFYP